jgi:hypothetical protein
MAHVYDEVSEGVIELVEQENLTCTSKAAYTETDKNNKKLENDYFVHHMDQTHPAWCLQ